MNRPFPHGTDRLRDGVRVRRAEKTLGGRVKVRSFLRIKYGGNERGRHSHRGSS